MVVLAVAGDMVLLPVYDAKDLLLQAGFRVRIVSIVNPRRLYRPSDVAWNTCAQADQGFLNDTDFHELFHGDVLLAISGGASATLEPVLLRSRVAKRDVIAWKRGETAASAQEIMEFNGITATAMVNRVNALLDA